MTKQAIAIAVTTAILFIWQFLSWSALTIHKDEFEYTPNQDKIMEALNQHITEEGTYMLPNVAPGSNYEQEKALMESSNGKPWATISYHKSMSTAMGMNMLRGLTLDAVVAWLLISLLLKMGNLNMASVLRVCLSIGLIAYLSIAYLHSIWFESNSTGYLIDAVVCWGIVGAWLGWWLPRARA